MEVHYQIFHKINYIKKLRQWALHPRPIDRHASGLLTELSLQLVFCLNFYGLHLVFIYSKLWRDQKSPAQNISDKHSLETSPIWAVRSVRHSSFLQSHKVCSVGIIANFVFQFSSLIASTDVITCEISNQGVCEDYILRLNAKLVWLIFNGRAKTKLATLAFLCCE